MSNWKIVYLINFLWRIHVLYQFNQVIMCIKMTTVNKRIATKDQLYKFSEENIEYSDEEEIIEVHTFPPPPCVGFIIMG